MLRKIGGKRTREPGQSVLKDQGIERENPRDARTRRLRSTGDAGSKPGQFTLLTKAGVISKLNNQRIPPVDPTMASGPNKKNFTILKSALGFIPNMALAMAQSPAVLQGYVSLRLALFKGRLGKRLGEELALTVAGANRCEYCASAHSTRGKLAGLKDSDVAAALQGKSDNAWEAAALKFASAVVEKRGRIDDTDFEAVTDAGFTPGEVSEIVAHVSLNTLTNYFNNVARIEIDSPSTDETKAA